MGKKMDKQLYERMRARGVRKRVARDVAGELGGADGAPATSAKARRAAADLSSAATEIEARMGTGSAKRSTAAKKAASTRKRKAAKRSQAAKRAARTRATT